MLGIEPYVLRFWETEFAVLSPKKSDSGHRLFRRKDVELLFRIKDLLYNQKFTIEGARRTLQNRKTATVPSKAAQQNLFSEDPIPQIRQELMLLLELLGN